MKCVKKRRGGVNEGNGRHRIEQLIPGSESRRHMYGLGEKAVSNLVSVLCRDSGGMCGKCVDSLCVYFYWNPIWIDHGTLAAAVLCQFEFPGECLGLLDFLNCR